MTTVTYFLMSIAELAAIEKVAGGGAVISGGNADNVAFIGVSTDNLVHNRREQVLPDPMSC